MLLIHGFSPVNARLLITWDTAFYAIIQISIFIKIYHACQEANKKVYKNTDPSQVSAPASPIWRGGPPLLPSIAAHLPFLSCPLSYFNSRHKTLHFGENFMKIGPKSKKLSVFKGQFYMYLYSVFEVFIVEWDYMYIV